MATGYSEQRIDTKLRCGKHRTYMALRKFSVRMRPHVARDLMCGFMILCAHDSIVKR